jgi:hypothetical protein
MSFKFINSILVLVVLFWTASAFSQKTEINIDSCVILENSDYFRDLNKFHWNKQSLYYLTKEKSEVSLVQRSQGKTDKLGSFRGTEINYLKDFVIDSSENFIYLLCHEKLVKYDISNLSTPLNILRINEYYDEVFVERGRILLTRCYNEATKSTTAPKPRILVLDANLNELKRIELNHDAIGLTHKPTYYIDVNYGKILFSNALKNKIEIIDIETFSTISIGDSSQINEGIDSLPLQTNIQPYSNPKTMIQELSAVVNKLNYIEGCSFLNDHEFLVVEKQKGSINKHRKIHLFRYNVSNNLWEYKGASVFSNQSSRVDKKSGIFQFYFTERFEIWDNCIALMDVAFPKGVKSVKKFSKQLNETDNAHFAIYFFSIRVD